jgi:hypothetical protein
LTRANTRTDKDKHEGEAQQTRAGKHTDKEQTHISKTSTKEKHSNTGRQARRKSGTVTQKKSSDVLLRLSHGKGKNTHIKDKRKEKHSKHGQASTQKKWNRHTKEEQRCLASIVTRIGQTHAQTKTSTKEKHRNTGAKIKRERTTTTKYLS